MAATGWFETVAEAQRRAQKRLPPSVYSALVAGSEKGVTVGDNLSAFSELGFAPHVAGLSAKRDMATTVMGQSLSMPVLMSPTGVQAVHPDGEVAVARAAAARGTAIGLSSFASKSVEEVAAANPQTFFQMYWTGGRDRLLARMERARRAGAVGLIITTDWSFSSGRDWGSPAIPSSRRSARASRAASRRPIPRDQRGRRSSLRRVRRVEGSAARWPDCVSEKTSLFSSVTVMKSELAPMGEGYAPRRGGVKAGSREVRRGGGGPRRGPRGHGPRGPPWARPC